MERRKPLLLGWKVNDRTGGGPLEPHRFRNSAGYRLWKLSGLPLDDYLAKFERKNASDAPRISDDRVIVLGRGAWREMGLPEAEWFSTIRLRNSEWTLIPHPSGRCHLYNSARVRLKVRKILRSMIE